MTRMLPLFMLPLLLLMPILGSAQATERLLIAGTGDSQILLRQIAAVYERTHPHIDVVVPDSIGSSGGIRAVIEGVADLGRVARPLHADETAHNLEYQVFAYSPVVFVTSAELTGVDSLSTEQLLEIFAGRISNWQEVGGPDRPILPVNREPGDSSRSVLEQHLPGFDGIRMAGGLISYTTPETRATLIEKPGAIGYLPLAMANDPALKILAVDGIRPDRDSVRSGRYPMVAPLGLVWKEPLGRIAQHFLFSLRNSEAEELIRRAGLVSAQ